MKIDHLDPHNYILIKGAKMHNLKNIDVAIPRNKMTVITGLSGSGKSSLAYDTLFAEGQRRYVESLSSYARQFMGRMQKPEVDYIKGIAPSIAIEQKVNTRNPRSTVGTSTEVYEYLKLFYARIGKTFSPISKKQVKRDKVSDVVSFVLRLKPTLRVVLYTQIEPKLDRSREDELKLLVQQGFTRIFRAGRIVRIEEVLSGEYDLPEKIHLIIDRFVTEENPADEFSSRVADSIETAYFEGNGKCFLRVYEGALFANHEFSNRFEMDGIQFVQPTVNLFTFNNPYGACKTCDGFGSVIGIDPDLVIPDKSKSVYDDAVACWKGEKMSEWKDQLVINASHFDFPIHKPIFELSQEQIALLWSGNKYFEGLNAFFKFIESQSFKIQYRVMLSRYRGKTICHECRGTRLRSDANYVKVADKTITDLVLMPISELYVFFQNIDLNEHEQSIADQILKELHQRLRVINQVGLGYLNLNRLSSTLSGGESQRINLANSLGSSLVGSIYILDEPSIGLHPRDTEKLVNVLHELRDIGNTVVVVEHDEDIMLQSDLIIDIGPEAGVNGGKLVAAGSPNEIITKTETLTAKYLNGELSIPVPERVRKWKDFIELKGVRENNLKSVDVKFPLFTKTIITGVSGSGKTSLVKGTLYPVLKKHYGNYADKSGQLDRLGGDLHRITDVELVDQNPIGKSSRSNPATYVKAFDDIRSLFADQKLAKIRSYKPGFFSFNTKGGRCEECQGEGVVTVEMQFMADIKLICDSCKGKRYKDEVLDVKVGGKNIFEVINLSVDESIEYFESMPTSSTLKRLITKLKVLEEVGLGYVQLGQSSNTLSGGEAQRIKLASFLSKGGSESPLLFIFDEPTTGLHFHDINRLNRAFDALLNKGHSLIIIEHNLDLIKCADWIIDLGPEGGKEGGEIVFEGTPEDLIKFKSSYTGQHLKKLNKRKS